MSLDYLTHLRSESERFLAALAGADPSARVPSCPEWNAGDLLWHLAEVQWFWAGIVEERRQSPEGMDPPPRPGDLAQLASFAQAQAARLHRVLAETDPATEVYMWARDRTAGYIRRRQAHEALIHRLDAELTTGRVSPLDADLAADGVLETLDVMYGGCPPWGRFTGDGRRVLFAVEDRPEQSVTVELGRFTGTDPDDDEAYDEDDLSVVQAGEGVPPLATVRGTADDLDAWLWHRRGDEAVAFEGDDRTLQSLLGLLRSPLN